MNSQAKSKVYKLSDYQKERVKQARIEYENGQVFSNEDVFNEIEKWLNDEPDQLHHHRITIV